MPHVPFNSETWEMVRPEKGDLPYVVKTPRGVTITIEGPLSAKVAAARAIAAVPELVSFVDGGIQFATEADLGPSAWESLENDARALLATVISGESDGPAYADLPDPVEVLKKLLSEAGATTDDLGNRGFWVEGLFYPSEAIGEAEALLDLMEDRD